MKKILGIVAIGTLVVSCKAQTQTSNPLDLPTLENDEVSVFASTETPKDGVTNYEWFNVKFTVQKGQLGSMVAYKSVLYKEDGSKIGEESIALGGKAKSRSQAVKICEDNNLELVGSMETSALFMGGYIESTMTLSVSSVQSRDSFPYWSMYSNDDNDQLYFATETAKSPSIGGSRPVNVSKYEYNNEMIEYLEPENLEEIGFAEQIRGDSEIVEEDKERIIKSFFSAHEKLVDGVDVFCTIPR